MRKKTKAAPRKAQFPTDPGLEQRLAAFLGRERVRRGLTLSRAQAWELLVRRGLDVEEEEARA